MSFYACGDDKSSSATLLPDEVANKAELETYECNMSVIGGKVFVKSLEKNYEILLSIYESGLRSIDLPKLTAMGFRSEFASTVVRGRTSLLMTCYDISYKMSDTKVFGIRKDLEKKG